MKTAYPVINLTETGRRIERYRRRAGLTVRDLQTFFGFEYPQAIYKWQRGQCLPTVDNLLALSRLLQVSMEDLLAYEDREVSRICGVPVTVMCLMNFTKRPKGSLPAAVFFPEKRLTNDGCFGSFTWMNSIR